MYVPIVIFLIILDLFLEIFFLFLFVLASCLIKSRGLNPGRLQSTGSQELMT